METDFKEKMATQSDEYLTDYVDNRMKYMPEAVEAAIAELEQRGKVFTDEERAIIDNDLHKKQEELDYQNRVKESSDYQYVVNNEPVPSYYSKTTIYVFSIVFSVFIGGILLGINLKNRGYRKEQWQAIALGILFSILSSTIMLRFGISIVLAYVLNALGAYLFEHLFWNKYLGREILYKARPIWIPLIICLALSTLAYYTMSMIAIPVK